MPLRDINEDRAVKVKSVLFGHIRLGLFNGKHPEQSKTFIFTSKDPERLKPLQRDLGGTIERYTPQGSGEEPWRLISDAEAFTCLPAFPTFETTVEQAYELWGAGGIKRSCDGFDATLIDVDEVTGEITEEQSGCICAAQDRRECAASTRLHVLIPQTGLGVWTLQTNSIVAATELFDQMQLVNTVAPDRLNVVPIRLVYGDRKLHYRDPKTHERKPTTKRIVSVSIAGDAERALAPLGVEPERQLLAAVRNALASSGRALSAGDPSDMPPAVSRALPASAPIGTPDPEPVVGGEAALAGASSSTEPRVPPTAPATNEQWAEAARLKLTKSHVLRRVNDERRETKQEIARAATDVTHGELERILKVVGG